MSAYWDDDWHINAMLRWAATPEARESNRQEHAAVNRKVADTVPCPECFALVGELCRGIAQGQHGYRGVAYARRGGIR